MQVQSQKPAISVVPPRLFRAAPGGLDNPRFASEALPAHEAQVGSAANISLRVDWDGDPAQFGSVEVEAPDGWRSVQNLDTETSENDLIFPAVPVAGEELVVDFERGPENPKRAFKVRAIAIGWNAGVTLPQEPDASFVAVRYQDYDYLEDPNSAPWHLSEPTAPDGTHRVTLHLPKDMAYEVWIAIQHPQDDNQWKDHDPVVRTGTGQTGSN